MLAALAATASAFVAPSAQAPRLTAPKALVEEGAFVPDMERRNIMNLILVFGGALPAVGGLAIPYLLFFIPRGGGGSGGLPALTKAGDQVTSVQGSTRTSPGAGSSSRASRATPRTSSSRTTSRSATTASTPARTWAARPGTKPRTSSCALPGSQYDETGKVVRSGAAVAALAHIEDNNGGHVTPWTTRTFARGQTPGCRPSYSPCLTQNSSCRVRVAPTACGWPARLLGSSSAACRVDGVRGAWSAAGARAAACLKFGRPGPRHESGPSILKSRNGLP